MPRFIVALCLSVSAIAVAAATSPAYSASGDMTESLQAFCRTFDTTWNNKGAPAIGVFFEKDAVFIGPSGAVVKGQAAITDMFRKIYSHGPTSHECVVESATSAGDGAWSYGEATTTGNPSGHTRWAAYDVREGNNWYIQMLTVIPMKQTK